jgi:hypothetical protein
MRDATFWGDRPPSGVSAEVGYALFDQCKYGAECGVVGGAHEFKED